MKSILLFFLAIMSLQVYSQITSIDDIPYELTDRPWLDQSVHNLYGQKIIMVFGERVSRDRHSNLGSITTVAYISPSLLPLVIDTLNISEKWKNQMKEKAISAAGGAIEIFIARPTESTANFRWYFLVIRGEDDKEKIMEIDLDYQASQLPYANGWWNHTIVFLPKAVEKPFYIYLNNKQSRHLSDFKYMITD